MKQHQASQLFSILLLLLLMVGFLVFVFPLRENVAALKLDKAVAADELQQAQADYDSLAALADEVAKSEATRQALIDAVPQGSAQDELILELSGIAETADFDLNAMNFTDAVDQDYGKVLRVNVNLAGDYGDLMDFLQALETADRLIRVTSMSVQLTSTSAMVFNVNFDAYYQ